jgi:hypothetical protein
MASTDSTYHLIMRWETAERAEASARRLAVKYGPAFAVTADPSVATHPFAVVTYGPEATL